MVTSKKIIGSIIATLGFLLSPLSWWNDLVVNIPLSYVIAVGLGTIYPNHFAMFMIVAYWMTNVAGLILMHKGGSLIMDQGPHTYNVRSVIKDLKVSLLYSLIIAALVVTGMLKLPTGYF